VTNTSGISTCSLSSLAAETKTLSIATPVLKADGAVVFTSGAAVAANSTITGTTPVIADGIATSTVTITLKDLNNNRVAGQAPTFSATDTGTNNTYTACSVTNASGVSTCTLASLTAETKTLSIVTPVSKADGTVIFTSGAAVAANSTITGTTSVVADGVTTSTITVTLKDASNNAVSGITPTFSATDTGANNNYGLCSVTNASGVSTCLLSSLTAETKTLSIATPVMKADGTVVFTAGAAVAANSTITGTSPVMANGVAASTVTVTLKDINNNSVSGQTPTFSATDSGTTNTYGSCSVTDAAGMATCSLTSLVAETKTLSIATPIVKADGTVLFTAGAPVAANSTITGTGPVIANGIATSTVTITLKDTNNNSVSGETPTFSATDSGSTNNYSSCSASNASGVSICTLSSFVAETKTLSIVTPVARADGTVSFTAGAAIAANSTITGTSPVVANGIATSTVTITLKDTNNNNVPGETPTFSATDTGTTNNYGSCSITNSSGVASCTLTSLVAETKTLSIATPVAKADGTVIFTAGAAVAANSTITGTSPIVANGVASSTVTITLKDSNSNSVSGQTPTFSATDSGSTNAYGSCSVTNAAGVSTCTLASLAAETKTLSIVTPVAKADGSVIFTAGAAVAANSTITGTGPVVANGVATSTVTITLKDVNNNSVSGETPTFSATDTGSANTYGSCSVTNASGVATCTLTSLAAETKTLSIVTPVSKADGSVLFTAGAAVAANSTITGTGPVVANGVATSTVTITLKDINNNNVSGETPTFTATDSSATNGYGSCSVTNASGVATCTLTSLVAESKTLAIATPVIKSDGAVIFTAGAAVAVNSTITGTSPVVANGVASSTVSITLKDTNNNPVSGQTPTFSATDTSSTNNYGSCSVTNASGVATCTLTSLIAETKTLSISTPVSKSDGTVVFTAGAAVAANSTITGTGPVVANGVATSTVTITLKDAGNNSVSGQTPTFSATDMGSTNTYGSCSVTDASGISTCTLSSLAAETKTLSIVTPVSKSDGAVIFTAGAAVATNSTITGTGPVVANGVATSTVTITLKDVNNNSVSGETPTFSATDTGTNNSYGSCSVTNAAGISTCTLSSLIAESKTLSIATPVVKADGTVIFTAGPAVATNSTITGTSPVIANGVATSTVTITLKDTNNNSVPGQTPTFSATDTGASNTYGSCSVTNTSGVATCTLASNNAETKALSIATPVSKTDGSVVFISGSAVAVNSTISGSGPVTADGISTSTVTITLKDASNNPVSGQTPTFSATDSGTTNAYGACSVTNASGIATCTLSSLTAETKTLSIVTPVAKADGTVIFSAGSAVATNSTITGSGSVVADGAATSTVTITLKDINNNTVSGQTPTFSATDTGNTNTYGPCSVTNASGVASCTLSSQIAETKTLSIVSPVSKTDGSVIFTAGAAVAANSTITGSGPVVADGVATSTVTITLKDVNNNSVPGETPTFTATDTGATNNYGTCSVTNASGISTCTFVSNTAETKTLSIATPVVKSGGTVIFTAGSAVAANSTITGSGPVIANGTATSTVTVTLKDIANNPVVGTTPTFSATDTGTTNVYAACSSTDASGISTCSLKSTKAETKTLSIVTPVSKADGTVIFTSGAAVASTSTITGTGPVTADGTSTSAVAITLKDINNNPVPGQTPTFTATNTAAANTYTACSVSDASGISNCSFKSTKAETKTLSIATPVVKVGGTVLFTAGSPAVAYSDITGTSPVSADGVSVSFITISLADAFSNPVAGVTPIFNATDTDSTNAYGACSATDVSGISLCTLSSTKAEEKTLQMTSPIGVTGSLTVTFSASLPTAANSTISGTGPVVADGATDSTVTITLKDNSNNPVPGIDPVFDATDTGAGNIYDACSMSDASGVSVCTFTSTKAETKTLRITSPVTKSDGTVVFTAGAAVAVNSTISGTGPVVANGLATSTISIVLKDINNNFVVGLTPTFSATNTGSGNTQTACSATNTSGLSTCTLKSTKAEAKVAQILTPVVKASSAIAFVADVAVAANSTITGTGPVNPDGSSTSTITITLKDANLNVVPAVIPTFSASGTNNTLGVCTAGDTSGVSTCTLSSTTSETKTLAIVTPVAKTDGTVIFQTGSATVANSSISATGPVTADGISTSTVTITLKDSTNLAVVGTVPVFTSSGTNNTIGVCSATDASGVSTCTLASTKAEEKTPQITSPIVKAGSSVSFVPGPASIATSTIVADSPCKANGVDVCNTTITIKDALGNAISGTVPTFTVSGTLNTIATCPATDPSGVSICEVTSTKAEAKTFQLTTPVSVAGNAVDFNPNGINIQVPIEMTDRGLSSTTTAVTFSRTRTSLNTADYVADINDYMFEVVAENTNTTTSYTINLVNSAGTIITDSAIIVPPSTVAKRFNVLWTPTSGADNYRIRIPNTAVAGQIKVHSAKMIVEQTAAVATKIYIPLSNFDYSGESSADTTAAAITSSTSTTYATSNYMTQWARNDVVYDAIAAGTPWTLETITSTSSTAGTVSASLYDKTANLPITQALTTVTGTTALTLSSVSFASTATNFNDGDILELRIKSNATNRTARIYKAGLWLKLKFLKKAEVAFRLATRKATATSLALPDGRFLWDAGAWSNPTVFFQTTAIRSGTSTVTLQDHGTNDNGTTSPTIVPGSTITPATTFGIQRSGALTLTDMNRYFVQHNSTSTASVLGSAYIFVRATE
jgi:adhesin/invasin